MTVNEKTKTTDNKIETKNKATKTNTFQTDKLLKFWIYMNL